MSLSYARIHRRPKGGNNTFWLGPTRPLNTIYSIHTVCSFVTSKSLIVFLNPNMCYKIYMQIRQFWHINGEKYFWNRTKLLAKILKSIKNLYSSLIFRCKQSLSSSWSLAWDKMCMILVQVAPWTWSPEHMWTGLSRWNLKQNLYLGKFSLLFCFRKPKKSKTPFRKGPHWFQNVFWPPWGNPNQNPTGN